ncbi:MAG TPA: leucine-rich repeat domain-containing protein [Clostridia bacterium]|nr:leucine-rich repeat domain-containing protein [Clostridia bacterium]
MKRVFCCLTAAVVLFGAVGCAAIVAPVVPDEIAPDAAVTQAPDDTAIVFDDPALEASIRETLGKPQGDITKADAQTLTELELSQQGVDPDQPYIHSLSALQYFTNLTYLGLGYAVQNADDPLAPVDLSVIVKLPNLESLQMAGVVIDDLSPLAKLDRLTSLTLFNGDQPLDLSPLAGLVNLEALTLRNNRISDLTPLSGLTKLRYLDLEGNQISDVSPLAGLTGLERLYLTDNPISDFSPLAEVRSDLLEWDFEVQ